MLRALAVLVCSLGLMQAEDVVPDFLISRTVGLLKVSYVDFGWAPEAFTAMETGAKHPAASREWMLAMVRVGGAVSFDGKPVPVGANLLVLVPKRGTEPMKLELRKVDYRDMLFEPNVIGEPPKNGYTVASIPAPFETVPEVAERMDMALVAVGNDKRLTIRYGNRRAELMFKAR